MTAWCYVYALICTAAICASECPSCQTLQGERALSDFGESIHQLTNVELGLEAVQQYFKNEDDFLHIFYTSINASRVQAKLLSILALHFHAGKLMLKNLEDTVQRVEREPVREWTIYHCCDKTESRKKSANWKFDTNYKALVNLKDICIYSTNVKDPIIGRDIVKAFINNRVTYGSVGWQHIDIIGGGRFVYPSVQLDNCPAHGDIRREPWFARVAMPLLDMVVVIDRSSSMAVRRSTDGRTLMDVAKMVAEQIINSFSAHSAIAVVGFSNETVCAGAPGGCYDSSLTAASWRNLKTLSKFIFNLSTAGKSSYRIGLSKASAMLSRSNSSRIKVIILISGAMPIDASDVVLDGKQEIIDANPGVHIVTVGIDVVDRSRLFDLLDAIAYTPDEIVLPFITVSPDVDIVQNLTPLYSYLSAYVDTQSTISAPYLSGMSSGAVWSLSKPFRNNGRLIGVVSVDISMSYFFDDTSFFKQTVEQYMFIIHQSDKQTIYHFRMPMPTTERRMAHVNIKHLENEAFEAGIIKNMLLNKNGSMVVNVTRTISIGNVYRSGYVNVPATATYYWGMPPGVPLAACTVISDPLTLSYTNRYQLDIAFGNIHYEKGVNLCNHFNRVSIVYNSTLSWQAIAYIRPVVGINAVETVEVLERYQQMLSGKITNTIFRKDFIVDVQLTRTANYHWLKTKHSTASIRRYIALQSGVTRIFPGCWNNRTYNAMTKTWYTKAVKFPDVTMITTPYLDSLGGGIIITLSKAVQLGRTPSDRRPIGVMGIDVTMAYFHARLKGLFTHCKTAGVVCFVIDMAGYVVIHDDMLRPPRRGRPPRTSYVHVTTLEPHVAADLLTRGAMTRISCHDLLTMRKYYMYAVTTSVVTSPRYKLARVPNTNVFVVLKDVTDDGDAPEDVDCKCAETTDAIPQCTPDKRCQCPCYEEVGNFDSCANDFSTNWTMCDTSLAQKDLFVAKPQFDSPEKEKEVVSSLSKCYAYDCHKYTSSEQCAMVSGCTWCVTRHSGVDIDRPYCGESEVCYYGQEGHESPYGTVVFQPTPYCGPWCSMGVVTAIFAALTLLFMCGLYIDTFNICDIIARPMRGRFADDSNDRFARIDSSGGLDGRPTVDRPKVDGLSQAAWPMMHWPLTDRSSMRHSSIKPEDEDHRKTASLVGTIVTTDFSVTESGGHRSVTDQPHQKHGHGARHGKHRHDSDTKRHRSRPGSDDE